MESSAPPASRLLAQTGQSLARLHFYSKLLSNEIDSAEDYEPVDDPKPWLAQVDRTRQVLASLHGAHHWLRAEQLPESGALHPLRPA